MYHWSNCSQILIYLKTSRLHFLGEEIVLKQALITHSVGLVLRVRLNLETCDYQQRGREVCLLWYAIMNIKTFKGFGLHFKLCLLQQAHSFLYSKASSKPTIKRGKHELHKGSVESAEQSCLKSGVAPNKCLKQTVKNQSSDGKVESNSKYPWSSAAPQPMTCLGGDHPSQAVSYWKQDLSICSAVQLQIQTGHYPSTALRHAHALCVLQRLSWIRTKKQLRPQLRRRHQICLADNFFFPSLVIPCLPKANRTTVACAYKQPGISTLLLGSYVTFFCATYNFH